MQRYIVRRLFQGLITLFFLAVVVFVLTRATGNPVELMAGLYSTAEDRAAMEKALGLDRPYPVQFYHFITGAVRGDFGTSTRLGYPATELFFQALPNSLRLIAVAMGFTFLMAMPLGVMAAVNRGRFLDHLARVIAVAGMAAPTFFSGIVLIYVFAVRLDLFPVARMGGPNHYVLPAFTLGFFLVAGMMRLLRSSMLEVLDSEFIKFARTKGVSERAVIWRHCLRNALIPVVSFSGVYFAILLTGAIVVETVFAWPGVGRLAYQAAMLRDFPVVQIVVLLAGAMIVVLNILVDILYAYLDPRIRYR